MTMGKLLLQTLVAAGDSATFGALFQVEKRHYLACAITGAAGWVTYCLAVEAGCSVAAASFLGALPLTLLARLYLRYRKLSLLQGVLTSLRPAVVAMIASAGVSILVTAFWDEAVTFAGTNWRLVVIFASSLLLLRRTKLSPILVMTLAGAANLLLELIPFPS